ncbi:DNA-processing protein DprA [Actinomycetes bacterium KLBMP 9797]
MTDHDLVRHARASLAVLFEPGNRQLHDLVAVHGPVATWHGLADGSLPLPGVRGDLRRVPVKRLWEVAARAADTADCGGGRVVTPEDDDWPRGLPDLAAVPARSGGDGAPVGALCLWVRGDAAVADTLALSVTVVGARACTAYGGHVAQHLGYGLAEQGWTVVSGGGFGVDAAAHKAAMVGGVTVAVLPCGLDRPYPIQHAAMLTTIADTGLLVSLWPPGTPPLRPRFTANGWLLAALTGGTVVVEAAHCTGPLIVLQEAIALGRAGMVVPGPVTSAQSAGCHTALREDSRVLLVTGVEDVLAELDAHAAPN